MANDSLNLLEWYAANRAQVEILRDPAALFALGLLDQVGQTPRAALQTDLGVNSAQLDQIIEKLYGAGFLSTSGTVLAVTPRGHQFLAEIGLRGPLPPTNLQEQTTDKPEPPLGLPERGSPAKHVSPPPPRTPIWLWGIIGVLIVGAILLFGALQGFGGGDSTGTPSAQQTFTPIPTDTPPVETEVAFVTDNPPSTPTETQGTVRVTLTPTDTPVRVRVTRTSTDTPAPVEVPRTPSDTPVPVEVPRTPTDTPMPVEITLTPTATETSLPQPTVIFAANPTQIALNGCAVLDWQIVNARAVMLNGERVELQDSLQVCPTKNTTYTLEIETFAGETIKQSLDVTVVEPALNYLWTVEFKNVPLNDSRVQDAIVHAINEKEISALVLGDQGSLSNTDSQLDTLEYDPKRALELLKEAGYDGQGLYIAGQDELSRKIGEYIAEYLAQVQVSAKVIDSLDSQTTIYVRPAQ